MIEPTQSRFDEQLARFAGGQLNAAEERELAQTALDSPAWFEELTDTSLAKTAATSVPLPAEPVRFAWWRSPFLLAASAVIVVAIVVLPYLYLMRNPPKRKELARMASPQINAPGEPRPTMSLRDGSSKPVLLAEGFSPVSPEPAQVFRGEDQPARPPRQVGAIVEIEDGTATINLGFVDGLAKGSEVGIYRDRAFKHHIGTLTLSTVFRDRARGEIEGHPFQVQYSARTSDRDHLQALLQAATDLQMRGELAQARRAAADANHWAKTAQVAGAEKAHAAELLGNLDFQAADPNAAEMHCRAALEMLSDDPNRSAAALAELQNDLAALMMLRGDYGSAQQLLDSDTAGLSDKGSKAERLNNRGVLAEERGARIQAENFYGQALELLPAGSAKQKIVEVNLNRVKGLP